MVAKHSHSHLPGNNPLRRSLDNIQDDLLELHLSMIDYSLERGYSFKRWQQIANTILFKDADNCRIHRAKVIHTYEADYNLAMGLKWRAAMYQAEGIKILNEGQYGSRPRRNAQDPLILEELQFEISRLTRKAFVQVNYDAMSCYDRIIPILTMLVSRKNGVPLPVVNANVETLEKSEYRIKKEQGMASTGYIHENAMPIYGTGQGSGNSPAIWCFVSSLLLDCYEESAYGAQYHTPDKSEHLSITIVGFVDDSNGQANCFQETVQWDELTLQAVVQHDAQLWTILLSASGGALELSRCSYHFLR